MVTDIRHHRRRSSDLHSHSRTSSHFSRNIWMSWTDGEQTRLRLDAFALFHRRTGIMGMDFFTDSGLIMIGTDSLTHDDVLIGSRHCLCAFF
jgi:hypothetical protein